MFSVALKSFDQSERFHSLCLAARFQRVCVTMWILWSRNSRKNKEMKFGSKRFEFDWQSWSLRLLCFDFNRLKWASRLWLTAGMQFKNFFYIYIIFVKKQSRLNIFVSLNNFYKTKNNEKMFFWAFKRELTKTSLPNFQWAACLCCIHT